VGQNNSRPDRCGTREQEKSLVTDAKFLVEIEYARICTMILLPEFAK
jgi:hypothetical protein